MTRRRLLLGFFALLSLVACGPKGSYKNIGPEELYQAVGTGAVIVDVRTPQEFAQGHVPGAVNLPLQEIAAWADKLPKDKPLIVHCVGGDRSSTAISALLSHGFRNALNLTGGIKAWQEASFPVEKGEELVSA